MVRPKLILQPQTTRTPKGFIVDGASPELLEHLLDAYAFEIRQRNRRVYDAMVPGLSTSQIQDGFATIGLQPPQEALVWWGWRNGFQPGVPNGLKHAQLSLSSALLFYSRETLGTAIGEWNPDWISIAGESNNSLAMCCSVDENPPRIRAVSTHDLGTQDSEDPIRQTVSLCTPVTWWLIALAKGWDRENTENGLWIWDDTHYPLEWKITGQM